MSSKKKSREELQLLRDEALEAYLNWEDFQYDLNADALYQHYKNQYTQLGKTAMQDTVGQASALTGGYGSSYAQNVGQQAYQGYLKGLNDVIPELYQLAYDRYQEKGNRLYQTYQSWAELEQQAAQQEQWDREYELEERKRQDAYNQFLLEQEYKNSQTQTSTYQPDHWAMLAHYQKLGQHTQSQDTAAEPEYDNGKVSEGNIKTMQRVLGLQETGKWTDQERTNAGDLTADKAWEAYQMGKLQGRSKTGMSAEAWAELKNAQSKSSGASNTKQTTPAVQSFISHMMTKEQAAKRGITSTEWEAMVIDRLNHADLSVDEFEQLEKHYGLDVGGRQSGTTDTADTSTQKMSYAEYREKTAAKKVADLNTAVQQYFRDYQAFANSAVYDLQNAGYRNATSMLETRIQTADELRKWADTLLTSLETSGDILTGDYSELLDLISSTREGIDSIMDALGGQARYYSQWDTEDAYNRAVERSKQYYDTWGHYTDADDFQYYAALGAAIKNPTLDAAEDGGRFLWWQWEGDDIGNIVTYSRENADMLATAYANGQETKGNYKYRSMKDEEVDIYNYLLAKEGKDKANELLSFLDEDLNAREGGELAERITGIDIPVIEQAAIGLFGLGAGVDQWASGTKQFFTNEQMPTTVEQYANAEIADSLDGFGKSAYTGANVIGNMAPSILLSYVTAGAGAPATVAQGVGAAAVGVSAAGNAYGSALRDGYSTGQARAYGTLVGAAEGTLQYILGGIGSLGGVTDDLIKAKINMIDNSLLRISAKLGVDVFSEVTEEELQNFLEPAFRSIIFGEEYDAPTIDEMIETAVVTGITTLILGGGDTISNDLRENGQLNATVQTANNQANAPVNQANTVATQEEVAKSLMSKGVSSKKADGIAEAIVARLNGQELTRTQRELLSFELGSPTVQSVISELIQKKSNGIDSTQHNVYDEISTIGGNAVTEDSAIPQSQNAPSEGSSGGDLEPGTLSNVDSRKWYLEQEAKIPNLIDASLPLEQQAKQAFDLRNQYRTQARELMSDRRLAESLYSTDPNLTWEQIVQKQIDKGLSGDDIYKAIIESSQRSRTSVNQSLGLE